MPSLVGSEMCIRDSYWVGAIDWGIRDFHGYSTFRGSTYNAYLIVADDVILIDTVKAPFKDELLSRVASVTDPENIRVCNGRYPRKEFVLEGCLDSVDEDDIVGDDKVSVIGGPPESRVAVEVPYAP